MLQRPDVEILYATRALLPLRAALLDKNGHKDEACAHGRGCVLLTLYLQNSRLGGDGPQPVVRCPDLDWRPCISFGEGVSFRASTFLNCPVQVSYRIFYKSGFGCFTPVRFRFCVGKNTT